MIRNIIFESLFDLDECSCKIAFVRQGYLPETMAFLELMYNFTWECTKEPNDNWGVVPITGPSNASGTWGGIMGDLVEEKFQLSVSAWLIKLSRSTMLSFAQIYPSGMFWFVQKVL